MVCNARSSRARVHQRADSATASRGEVSDAASTPEKYCLRIVKAPADKIVFRCVAYDDKRRACTSFHIHFWKSVEQLDVREGLNKNDTSIVK